MICFTPGVEPNVYMYAVMPCASTVLALRLLANFTQNDGTVRLKGQFQQSDTQI